VEKQIGFGTGSDIVIKITDPVTCAKGRGGARANTPHPSGKKNTPPQERGEVATPQKKSRRPTGSAILLLILLLVNLKK